jgi:Phosphatidylinositol-glycan biosynthesis class S protein
MLLRTQSSTEGVNRGRISSPAEEVYGVTMAPGEGDDDGSGYAQGNIDTGPPKTTSGEPEMASVARKQPPPEKPEAVWLRTKVILSFWAVIVFLGLPVWWQTTSIYRARLPIQDMLAWSTHTASTMYQVSRAHSWVLTLL